MVSGYGRCDDARGSLAAAERASLSVLHVVTSNRRRGAETAAVTLAERLRHHDVDGEVVALADGGGPAALGVEVLGPRSRSPQTLRRLRRRAEAHSVVVAHGSDTLLASALALADGRRPFLYLSIGDPRRWARGARRAANAGALRRAAGAAALTADAARTLSAWYGMPAERIHVLPNFRSARQFVPASPGTRAAARRSIGVPEHAPVVAVIGSLSPEKRVDAAVAAALRVPAAHAVVAGDGPDRARVLRAAAAGAGRVHVLGAVEDPVPVLHAADVLLMASSTEGVPGVLIEAGLCGVPAVTTDVGWVRDVVRDGWSGRVVPPGDDDALVDAVVDLLGDRDRAGARAREDCAHRFADDVVVPRWRSVLGQVADTARTTGDLTGESRGESW